MLRLMGIDPRLVEQSVLPPRELGHLIGNAMSTNVLERIFLRLLPAVGRARREDLRGRWESIEESRRTLHEMRN